MWMLAISRVVVPASLAVATYWQPGRCAVTDLGDSASLSTCVESVVLREDGSFELHLSWRGSGLSGKSLTKGSDARNRRMYLLDAASRRYDHVETKEAAAEGGRLDDDHPVLRGALVFPHAPPEGTTLQFRDDDQKVEIPNISLSPELRTATGTSSVLTRIGESRTIRVDYVFRGERQVYFLRKSDAGFVVDTDGDRKELGLIPGAALPASVMDSFFETLAASPLLGTKYDLPPVRSEDVAAITLDLRNGNDNVFFFSRLSGERHLPWTAQVGTVPYVVPDATPLRALEILEPFFGLDPDSRAMKLLSPSLGEEQASELWAKLEAHAGTQEALRLARRLRDLPDREVPAEDIVAAVEEYVTKAPVPETPEAVVPSAPAENEILEAVANPEVVRSLIAARADLEARGRDGKTALMLAAEGGRIDSLKLLLDAGAKPNEQTQRGSTALILAARNHRVEAVRLLLGAGADPNLRQSDGSTALLETSEPNVVRALIRARANVNQADENGMTAMMRLIERPGSGGDRSDALRSLLTAGADVRLRDRQGRTALIWAAKGTPSTPSYPELVAQLVEAGSELDARDREGGTALVYAVVRGDSASAKLLIDAGCDVNAQMGNLSPMELALRYGRSEIVTLLLRSGARR